MATARTARWWMITAGLVATGACATALAGSAPASSYLLSVKNLPRGFHRVSQVTLSSKVLNVPGGSQLGSCDWNNYVHFTGGAYITFTTKNGLPWIGDDVYLGATVKGTRRDANEYYAHAIACKTPVPSGLVASVAPTTPMHTISNGARMGVLVVTWTDQGVPYELGLGVAQRGHAEMFSGYELISTDVHLASSRTLSLTLLAIGHLPRH